MIRFLVKEEGSCPLSPNFLSAAACGPTIRRSTAHISRPAGRLRSEEPAPRCSAVCCGGCGDGDEEDRGEVGNLKLGPDQPSLTREIIARECGEMLPCSWRFQSLIVQL